MAAPKNAYVYELWRPDTVRPFYVGVGCGKRVADYRNGRNAHFRHVVAKLNRQAMGVVAKILVEGLTWGEACDIERQHIALYGRTDLGLGPLVNMTDGGEGAFGHIKSAENRAKLRAANLGKKKSPEARLKMRLAKLGKPQSAEHRKNRAKALRGKKRSPEAIEKTRRGLIGKKKGPQSPEHRQNISASNRGRKLTPARREQAIRTLQTYWIEQGRTYRVEA